MLLSACHICIPCLSFTCREPGFSAKLVKGSKFKSKKRYRNEIKRNNVIIALSTSDTRGAESHEAAWLYINYVDLAITLTLVHLDPHMH